MRSYLGIVWRQISLLLYVRSNMSFPLLLTDPPWAWEWAWAWAWYCHGFRASRKEISVCLLSMWPLSCLAIYLIPPRTEKMQLPPPLLPFLLSLPSFPTCNVSQPSLLCSAPLGPVIIRKWRKEGSQPGPSGLQRELGLRAGDPGLQRFQYLFFFPYHRTCQHTGSDAKHQGGAKSRSSCFPLAISK